ncbi:MAG TPA: hypothetical protein VGI12_17350 [Vicinamibacterales bacterium]
MNYWRLAGVSALSAFALFTLAGGILARAAAMLLDRRLARAAAASRGRLLFAIQIFPLAAATVAAFAVVLPIFLWFEERDTIEPINRTLGLLALVGGALLCRAIWLASSAWRATTAVVRGWQRNGRLVEGLATDVPCYAIDEAFPLVAVAGLVRPRLFIAERVLREFPADEIAAMVAHECAHVAARDNVKRLLLRACPDVIVRPRLERDWAAAAEEAADDSATAVHPATRLHLARALIQAARLATPSTPQLASAFYRGGSIEVRVRRLIEPVPTPPAAHSHRLAAAITCVLLAAALIAAAPSLHGLMEQAVQLLP